MADLLGRTVGPPYHEVGSEAAHGPSGTRGVGMDAPRSQSLLGVLEGFGGVLNSPNAFLQVELPLEFRVVATGSSRLCVVDDLVDLAKPVVAHERRR